MGAAPTTAKATGIAASLSFGFHACKLLLITIIDRSHLENC